MSIDIDVVESSIELDNVDDYQLFARGKLAIDGPYGFLAISKKYHARPLDSDIKVEWESNPEIEDADTVIVEHIQYMDKKSLQGANPSPFETTIGTWNTSNPSVLDHRDSFGKKCRMILLKGPKAEYERYARRRRFSPSSLLGLG